MPSNRDIRNCHNLTARANRLRDQLCAIDRWENTDEGDWEEIRPGGALYLLDYDEGGYAWNEVTTLCDGWAAELEDEH